MKRKNYNPRYTRAQDRDRLKAKAVAYLRTSTEEQELGIEAQRAQLQKWSAENAIEIIMWFEDQGISGTVDPAHRPALARCLDRISRADDIDYLVIVRLDRLARDTSMLGFIDFTCARRHCRVVTCAQDPSAELTPEQKLLRGVMATIAEYERALISFRTAGALAAAKARGAKLGRRKRLSYRTNCKLFYVIQYLTKYGCTQDYIRGYLANHCATNLEQWTISKYVNEDEVPAYFPIKEVVQVLKPFYRLRNGKHVGLPGNEIKKVEWGKLK